MKLLELFVLLVINFVDIFLTVILFAMLVRAIMSLFMLGEDGAFGLFLFSVTEPFIVPVRVLFAKLGWFQGTPLDASFFFACLMLGMIKNALAFIPISF